MYYSNLKPFRLDLHFEEKILELLYRCHQRGMILVPTEGLRSPVRQAKIWKQSRTHEEINQQIDILLRADCLFLAAVMDAEENTHGPHVTNALPGFSWHQWGEALDCCWVINGRRSWSLTETLHGLNGYTVMAEEALLLGLDPGLFWQKIKDGCHVQLRKSASPKELYSLQQIDSQMRVRFPALAARLLKKFQGNGQNPES